MGAAAAQCSGVPCLKLLCKSITEPGIKSTAFEVRQQSFLCRIRKGSFQALHWWLSGLHSSPAVMEEPLRPAGKPRCEQKVHCAPTPGHVRSGWPELTEMIFFSNMCRFTFHLWWENAAGTKPRGDGDNQHCPPQLGAPQAAVGSRLPHGARQRHAVLGQGLLPPGMQSLGPFKEQIQSKPISQLWASVSQAGKVNLPKTLLDFFLHAGWLVAFINPLYCFWYRCQSRWSKLIKKIYRSLEKTFCYWCLTSCSQNQALY